MQHIKTDRRTLIVSAAAAAAGFGLGGPLAFLPSARAAELADQGFYKFAVGDLEFITVFDGQWNKGHAEGFIKNASVADAKAALESAGQPPEDLTIPFTITFVKTAEGVVMFDAGTGGQLAPTAGKLAANMEKAGIAKGDIKTIVLTHFHPDHIFGLMEKETNAQVYPDARIVAPQAEYDFWVDDSIFSKLPEARHGLAKRIQATFPNWKNFERFEGEKEVVKGITAIPAHGHTAGHTAFLVAAGSDQVLVLADTANIPALFVRNPGWHVAFDAAPEKAEATRRRLFDRAVADNAVVTGYHFGMPGAGRIEKDGDGYAFVPLA